MKLKDFVRNYASYLYILAIFALIAVLYCSPVLEGKVMNQMDTVNAAGSSQELKDFYQEHGEYPWWTNSMFSGMPAFQIAGATPSSTIISKLGNLLRCGFNIFSPIGLLLSYFIGFFILFMALGCKKWLSAVGSIAITFSSYFFIIIAAGHLTKIVSLAFMAPVVAGFILLFKKKYFWGICLTMLYTAVGFMPHIQMSYYLFMFIGLLGIAEAYIHIKEKRFKDFFIALALFVGAFGIGVGANFHKIWSNAEYVQETMRGGHSEIVKEASAEKSTGLSTEYATAWSYGIDETMTLLIPNFKGGSSHYNVGTKSKVYEAMIQQNVPKKSAENFCQALPMYWGTQPFTAGPVYAGAIVCFLFVLGLFIVKGPYKWAILVATLMSIFLSWGHNMMWLTQFFLNYFPMYDKFRAVSSILIVAEITIPLLGFLAIKTIADKTVSREKILKSIWWSCGITAGICLLFGLLGKSFFSFSSTSDAGMFAQLPTWLSDAIIEERISMFRSDAFRSCGFICAAAIIVWFYVKEKLKFGYFVALLGVLVLADMWPIDKRFFGNDMFVSKKQKEDTFKMLPYEAEILKDKDLYFRVLNLTTNTFNDSRTSYYLKSIGGYHGAKLRRYQDLIDEHITKNNFAVLNMLNAKYIIVNDPNGNPVPQYNQSALGNAWFVDSLQVVETPNQESEALNHINLAATAVVDKKFEPNLTKLVSTPDSSAYIKLTKYAANELAYTSNSAYDKTAVFSDIYYPYGWNAYIDDKPAEHFRVDYVLRALNIPAGQHKIRFEFKPKSIYVGDKISMACVILMFCIIAGCITAACVRRRRLVKG